jgi:teichuronic acid biosynthesis glycosyltransferase TuaC
MKILFVCSGNSKEGISPIVKNQGESVKKQGVNVDYFTIKGKGIKAYIKNILLLRRYLKTKRYDIYHAHYSLSALTSILAGCKPIIVSLMGSDTYGIYDSSGNVRLKSVYLIVITQLVQLFSDRIIVKSHNLASYVRFKKKSDIIPNGVDLDIVKTMHAEHVRKELQLNDSKKIILFMSDKKNDRKNFKLLGESYNIIKNGVTELATPYPVPFHKVPKYLNVADVLVLTSYNEGSPNIIKEAMACNCPIVATNVGDVKSVMGDTEGCYITTFEPEDVADKIKLALEYSDKKGRTKGRERIFDLGLDSETIASKIITVYEKVLTKN